MEIRYRVKTFWGDTEEIKVTVDIGIGDKKRYSGQTLPQTFIEKHGLFSSDNGTYTAELTLTYTLQNIYSKAKVGKERNTQVQYL